MAVLTVQDVVLGGTEVTFAAAAAGGDSFPNDGRTWFRVKNGGGADRTVTVNSQRACDQGFDHDQAVVVTAGEERDIGPFPTERFNDTSARVVATYSSESGLTVAALRLPGF
jgi:hypothetical protein